MVRLALIVTPAAAVVAGYTLDEVLRPFALINQERFTISRRKRRAVKQIGKELISVTYVFVAVALMLTVIFGANILKRQYYMNHELTPRLSPQGGGSDFMAHDYQEMFDFLRVNIAPYSAGEKPPIVMSWWDYGYQLSVLGNVTTLVDNATVNSTQIGIVGAMLIHNETASLKLLEKFGVDYVLVLSTGVINSQSNDLLKSQWMMQISETEATQYLHEYAIKYEDYFNEDTSDPENYGFTDLFWQSVVYKLSAYWLNSDGIYGDPGSQAQVSNWRGGLLASAPDINAINSHFKLVYQSSFAILRLYEVSYD